MTAIGQFLYGLAAELTRVALVLAAGMLSAHFFGGRVVGGPLGALVIPLAIVAAYAALAIVPARDIAQGWLGMIAGMRPAAFGDPAQNLGRAVADVAAAVGTAVLLVVTFGATSANPGDSASEEAMSFAYAVITASVFCLGAAVPRVHFGLCDVPDAPAPPPALLQQAGRRASTFCYCAFVTIGVAFVAARVVADSRGLRPPATHHAQGARLAPLLRPPVHAELTGTLAQSDAGGAASPELSTPWPGRVTVRYSAGDVGPACPVSSVTTAHGSMADASRRAGELVAASAPGAPPFVVTVGDADFVDVSPYLTEDLPRCSYRVVFDEVAP
nr:hypothetical protein [Kofleriaceae bacterium]